MCELLATNFNKPVRMHKLLPLFQARARGNPHGWGFARVDRADNRWDLAKEPASAEASALASQISSNKDWVSDIVLGHVRFASQGAHTYINTHPFVREHGDAGDERTWVFAHNGTLWGLIEPKRLTCPVEGQTDSEQLLCSIITVLDRLNLSFYDFAELERILQTFNGDGSMNLVFSDGSHTFVYKDSGAAFGLDIIDAESLVQSGHLEAEDGNNDDLVGYVVTTRGLTANRGWSPIAPGSLLVFSCGEVVYGYDSELDLSEEELAESSATGD